MLRSSVIYFVGRFGAALIAFLALAAYTRLLTPEGYGVYALVQAGVAVAYAGLMQWLMISLGRFMPEYRGREQTIRSHVAVAYLISGALALLLAPVLGAVLATEEIPETAIFLGIAIFLAMGLAELTLVQFNMLVQPGRYASFALLRVAVATASGVALVYAGLGAIGALLGALIGHLVVVVPNLHGSWGSVRLRQVERPLVRDLARFGLPYALSGILAAVINLSDRYLIQYFLSTEAAGLYAAPYDLAMRSLNVLMMIVAMAGNPFIFRTYDAHGWEAAVPLIRRQFELLAAVTLPIAIGFALLAPAIVSVLLGAPFQQAGRQLLPWIALATVLQGFQGAYLSLAFVLTKKPLRQTYIFLAGALLNIGLNLVLIQKYGLIGAAIATVIAFLMIVICSLIVGRRLLPLPVSMRSCGKLVAGCIVFSLILWPVAWGELNLPLVLYGTAAVGCYVLVVIGLDVGGTRPPLLALLRTLAGKTTRMIRSTS